MTDSRPISPHTERAIRTLKMITNMKKKITNIYGLSEKSIRELPSVPEPANRQHLLYHKLQNHNKIYLDLMNDEQNLYENTEFDKFLQIKNTEKSMENKLDASFGSYSSLITRTQRTILSVRYDRQAYFKAKTPPIQKEVPRLKNVKSIRKPEPVENDYQIGYEFRKLKEEQAKLLTQSHLCRANKLKLKQQFEDIQNYLKK